MKIMIPVVSKVAVAAALLGVSLSSNAVEITYEGSTAGSFSDATTANYLSFTGVDFGPALTVDGSALLSNLGSFTISLPSANPGVTATGSFSLDVTFTMPSGANAASPIVATVAGTINKNNANNVYFDFGAGQTIHFSNAEGSGSFLFSVYDVSFPNGSGTGSRQTLTGAIDNVLYIPLAAGPVGAPEQVPEPGTLALLGLGLAGLGLSRRRGRT